MTYRSEGLMKIQMNENNSMMNILNTYNPNDSNRRVENFQPLQLTYDRETVGAEKFLPLQLTINPVGVQNFELLQPPIRNSLALS